MRSAPGPVGPLFGLSLALLILLLGPLLLFNPPFVYLLQQRHHVAETSFDGQHDVVDGVTLHLVSDIWTDGGFDVSADGVAPVLSQRERSHMHDVARLVRVLAGIVLVSGVVAVVTGWWLRREPLRQGRVMLISAGTIGAVALVLAIVFAVAFEPAFLAFHQLFFPPGTYLFEPGSNLIALFPEDFWLDASLAAGATIVLAGVVVAVIGWRRMRSARAPAGA
jgi:hypothetical protein